MRTRFDECLKRGKIIPTDYDADLVAKEFAESITDLQYAKRSIHDENLKWAIVQSYYAIFHGFRALLLAKGFREKSHLCLRDAIEALYVDEGYLPEDFLYLFDDAKNLRESADYGCIYDHSLAQRSIESGTTIIEFIRSTLLHENYPDLKTE